MHRFILTLAVLNLLVWTGASLYALSYVLRALWTHTFNPWGLGVAFGVLLLATLHGGVKAKV